MTSQLKQRALSSQGLTSEQFAADLSGTLEAIEHLGYVQIDTLSVVERAHHHVLWNRVPSYDPAHLNQLIRDQQIFEYWYHAASYLPMRDYRFALPRMESIRNGETRYYKNIDEQLMKEVLACVNAEGPSRLRDLNIEIGEKGKGSWRNQGPTRRAIDKLFMQGDLMVCGRNGMEKVYDLTERCLPDGIDLSMPTLEEYATYLFDTTLRSHGVFTLNQLLHLKKGKPIRDAMAKVLRARLEEGVIEQLTSSDGTTLYVGTSFSDAYDAQKRARKQSSTIDRNRAQILSPFDNVLIHRDRLSSLFGFEYKIECYVPAAKRVYGYFCLPILYGDRFVARIDCKAHRAEQRFEVLSLHLEADTGHDFDRTRFFYALKQELQRFAEFNKCPQLDANLTVN